MHISVYVNFDNLSEPILMWGVPPICHACDCGIKSEYRVLVRLLILAGRVVSYWFPFLLFTYKICSGFFLK